MKKIVIAVLSIFSACVIGLGMKICIMKSNIDSGSREQYTEETDNKISNSERYNNKEVSAIIDDYAERYHHSFTFVSTETEEQLYGAYPLACHTPYNCSSVSVDTNVNE